jgi:hypothetical protein
MSSGGHAERNEGGDAYAGGGHRGEVGQLVGGQAGADQQQPDGGAANQPDRTGRPAAPAGEQVQ